MRERGEGFGAEFGPIDEDGYRAVIIYGPDYEETYSLRSDSARQWAAQELAILNGPKGECPHGLSAALCSGPNHY